MCGFTRTPLTLIEAHGCLLSAVRSMCYNTIGALACFKPAYFPHTQSCQRTRRRSWHPGCVPGGRQLRARRSQLPQAPRALPGHVCGRLGQRTAAAGLCNDCFQERALALHPDAGGLRPRRGQLHDEVQAGPGAPLRRQPGVPAVGGARARARRVHWYAAATRVPSRSAADALVRPQPSTRTSAGSTRRPAAPCSNCSSTTRAWFFAEVRFNIVFTRRHRRRRRPSRRRAR